MAMLHQDTYKSKRQKARDPVDKSEDNKPEIVQATASNNKLTRWTLIRIQGTPSE